MLNDICMYVCGCGGGGDLEQRRKEEREKKRMKEMKAMYELGI